MFDDDIYLMSKHCDVYSTFVTLSFDQNIQSLVNTAPTEPSIVEVLKIPSPQKHCHHRSNWTNGNDKVPSTVPSTTITVLRWQVVLETVCSGDCPVPRCECDSQCLETRQCRRVIRCWGQAGRILDKRTRRQMSHCIVAARYAPNKVRACRWISKLIHERQFSTIFG
jgi:hypothetical protein